MTKQELLNSLAERRSDFESLLEHAELMTVRDVVKLLKEIEKDAQKLVQEEIE